MVIIQKGNDISEGLRKRNISDVWIYISEIRHFAIGPRPDLGLQIPFLNPLTPSLLIAQRIRTIVIIYRLESRIHKLGGPLD